jgi:hypothetical protein
MPGTHLEVASESGGTFRVTVHGARTTKHLVTVTEAVHGRLAPAGTSVEDLIEESFRFLLERESNTSILPSFDLPLIGRYFPEYESEIGGRFSRVDK